MIVFSPLIILIGFGFDVLAYGIHFATGWKLSSSMPFTALFFGFWLTGLMLKYMGTGGISTTDAEPDLRKVLDRLQQRLGLSGLDLKITRGSEVKGMLIRQTIYISGISAHALSPSGLEFILAHEMAHKRFQSRSPEGKTPKVVANFLICYALIMLLALRFAMNWYWYFAFAAPLVASIFWMAKNHPTSASSAGPDMELACDYVALSLIEDPQGAIEVLEKTKHGTKFDRKLSGYPSKETRVEQVRDFIDGKPRPTYENAFVEEGIRQILFDLDSASSPPE